MAKKIYVFLLVALLLALSAGCGAGDAAASASASGSAAASGSASASPSGSPKTGEKTITGKVSNITGDVYNLILGTLSASSGKGNSGSAQSRAPAAPSASASPSGSPAAASPQATASGVQQSKAPSATPSASASDGFTPNGNVRAFVLSEDIKILVEQMEGTAPGSASDIRIGSILSVTLSKSDVVTSITVKLVKPAVPA